MSPPTALLVELIDVLQAQAADAETELAHREFELITKPWDPRPANRNRAEAQARRDRAAAAKRSADRAVDRAEALAASRSTAAVH